MTIAIRQLTVPRHNRLIFNGQVVNIIATIADVGLTSTLLTAGVAPTISLYGPDDSLLVDNADMEQISTGVYSYPYQTTYLNGLGVYTASVQARYQSYAARLNRIAVFKIIGIGAIQVIDTFSYFAIKDQESTTWYWYINEDNTLNFSLSIPERVGKVAVDLDIEPIPYWLEIENPDPTQRYVYPHVSGEFLVSVVEPSVGTGYVGSPVFKGLSPGNFVITLSAADEVLVIPEP
jgi:hypothetical protein